MAEYMRKKSAHQRWILGVGAIVIAAMVFGTALRPFLKRKRAADLEGAVAQASVATVTARFGANANTIGDTIKPWAQVRFRGKLFAAQEAKNVEQLREGESATITFRVGKSGRIYVDTVEPVRPQVPGG
jgi:hypothetical protein